MAQKRTGVPRPNVHWGDGSERDIHAFANLRLPLNASGSTELCAFGGYADRYGTGNGFFRKLTNALDTKTDGVDVAANYRVLAGSGTLDFTAAFNYTKNAITRVDPLPKILEGTGTSYTSALDIVTINAIERNRPGRRSSLTTNYAIGRFHAMGRVSDYGSFVDGSLDGLETFGAKTTFDTELGYRFDAINVSVGMRNVFNTYPDQVKVEANTNNGTFIYPGASPFGYNGRFLYVRSEILLSR